MEELITWEKLEEFIWKNNCAQITIDMVQNAHMDFDDLNEFQADTLGAFIYQLRCVMDVMDKSLKLDINVLSGLMLKLEGIYKEKEEQEKLSRQKFGELS